RHPLLSTAPTPWCTRQFMNLDLELVVSFRPSAYCQAAGLFTLPCGARPRNEDKPRYGVAELLGNYRFQDVLLEFTGGIGKAKGNLDDGLVGGHVEVHCEAGIAADPPLAEILAEPLLRPVPQLCHESERGVVPHPGS